MNRSELVTPQHLARKAIIYIRQSSPHQMLSNQESLRLQYALEQRALAFGWRPEDVDIIDADLGLTGASAQHREGFKEVVSRVTLGQVGIILSSEVTRLSRNCSDWYPLLDICVCWPNCLSVAESAVTDMPFGQHTSCRNTPLFRDLSLWLPQHSVVLTLSVVLCRRSCSNSPR